MALSLQSSAFEHEGNIPAKYTCEGVNISPPLQWQNIPAKTQSLVLIIDDPDAPDPKAPKMTWVHWVVYNIPSECTGLNEGAAELPGSTEQGKNDWNKTGYGGPCPPIGRHRYFHKLYALDTTLTGLKHATKKQVEATMQGHILAQANLVGLYKKSK